MKYFLSTLLLVSGALWAQAAGERFSYLYLQGDKQTPFYVKLEDAMQPRFGKNYCIIPKMAPGPAHIEILFQQNIYPAQKFTVLIPEAGSRAFLLVKKQDSFMLYDLQQGFYLASGNTEEDDRMPAAGAPPVTDARQAAGSLDQSKTSVPEKSEDLVPEKNIPVEKPHSEPVTSSNTANDKPVFIPDLELTKEKQKPGENIPGKEVNAASSTGSAISNTDCPTPISAAEFGKIFSGLGTYKTDEDRLEYLGGQMNVCYESWQARTLAGKLEGDAARYELLHKIYPRITDQGAFPLLDDLLTTEVWKAEFLRLVHH